MALHPDMRDFSYVTIALYVVALMVTSIRAFLRLRKSLWWWDDTFAVFAMFTMTSFLIGSLILAKTENGHGNRQLEISGYYMLVVGFYLPIWAARLSILFSVIRIALWPRQRKILLWVAAFFVFQWVFLMVETFWFCEITRTAWKNVPGALCFLGDAVATTQAATTFISDLMLIASPLWLLKDTHVNPTLRFRLNSVFSISVVTIIAATAHAVLAITSPGVWEAIFGTVEIFTTLTVGSGSVLIPAALRLISDSDMYNDAATTTGAKARNTNNTMLSTLKIINPSTAIKVEVTVDHEDDKTKDDCPGGLSSVLEDDESMSHKTPVRYGVAR